MHRPAMLDGPVVETVILVPPNTPEDADVDSDVDNSTIIQFEDWHDLVDFKKGEMTVSEPDSEAEPVDPESEPDEEPQESTASSSWEPPCKTRRR